MNLYQYFSSACEFFSEILHNC